jgi:hypothetical protein
VAWAITDEAGAEESAVAERRGRGRGAISRATASSTCRLVGWLVGWLVSWLLQKTNEFEYADMQSGASI